MTWLVRADIWGILDIILLCVLALNLGFILKYQLLLIIGLNLMAHRMRLLAAQFSLDVVNEIPDLKMICACSQDNFCHIINFMTITFNIHAFYVIVQLLLLITDMVTTKWLLLSNFLTLWAVANTLLFLSTFIRWEQVDPVHGISNIIGWLITVQIFAELLIVFRLSGSRVLFLTFPRINPLVAAELALPQI